MRTTLNIDDELLKKAKIAAINEGITLTQYIERALAHHCLAEPKKAKKGEWTFPTFKGEPMPDFPWTGSLSEILEFVEGPDADTGR